MGEPIVRAPTGDGTRILILIFEASVVPILWRYVRCECPLLHEPSEFGVLKQVYKKNLFEESNDSTMWLGSDLGRC